MVQQKIKLFFETLRVLGCKRLSGLLSSGKKKTFFWLNKGFIKCIEIQKKSRYIFPYKEKYVTPGNNTDN